MRLGKTKKISFLFMVAVICGIFYCQPVFAASKDLTSLKYADSHQSFDSSNWNELSKGITTPTGKTYTKNVLFLDASLDAYVTYNLNKNYTKLTGKLVTSTRTGGGNFTVAFYGDGKLLKKYTGITNSNQNKSVSVDVTNVKKLKIVGSNQGSWSYGWVFLVDGKLTQGQLTLSDKKLVMNQKESTYITWNYIDSKGNASTPSAKWKSSNTKVAKVSSKGKVVAVGAGTCKLTCTVNKTSKTVTVVVKPKKVTSVATLSKTTSAVQLKWGRQNGVTSYQIYMYDADLEEYTRVKTVSSSVQSARITGLKKGKTYKFKVRACLKSGSQTYYGDFSKVHSVKIK